MGKYKALLLAILAASILISVMPAYAFTYADRVETSSVTSLGTTIVRDKITDDNAEDSRQMDTFLETYNLQSSWDDNGHYVAFDREKLLQIFGQDAEITTNNGLLKVRYMQRGQLRDFGYFHGILIANPSTKQIDVRNGGFVEPMEHPEQAQIAGAQFTVDVSNPSKAIFTIIKGVYLQGTYFVGCKDAAERQISCSLKAVVTPQSSYLNVSGEGFVSVGTGPGGVIIPCLNRGYRKVAEDMESGIISKTNDNNLYTINNIAEIRVKSSSSKFLMSAKPMENAMLFLWKLQSENTFEASRLKTSVQFTFIGNELKVSPFAMAMYFIYDGLGLKSAGEGKTVSFLTNSGNEFVEISGGGAFFFLSENADYLKCKNNEAPFNGMACVVFSDYRANSDIQIIPRRLKDGDNYRNFIASITLPLHAAGIIIDKFEREDANSFIAVNKPGIDTELTFFRTMLDITEDRNWYDLGIGFSAYLYIPEEGVRFAPYDFFECKNPLTTKDCYLNQEQVFGYFERARSRSSLRCERDSDCGLMGQVCIGKMCVAESECLSYRADIAAGKAHVVLVSDGYSDENEFFNDVDKVLDLEDNGIGIFSIEPFKSNVDIFMFSTIFGGNSPATSTDMGMRPMQDYINSMYMQCPDAKYALVLSKKPFRSHAMALGRDPNSWAQPEVAYVSMRDTRSTLPVHEFGHSFGGLRDEYYEVNPALNGLIGDPNCITKEEALVKWAAWPDIIADVNQEKWKGCGGICGSNCANLLRPTENSIMRYHGVEPSGTEFNEPSKKQLIDRIYAWARISAITA